MGSYFNTLYEDFKKSLEFNRNMLYSIAFDFIFAVLAFFGFYVWAMAVISKGSILKELNYMGMMSLDKNLIMNISDTLSGFIFFMFFTFILFWIFFILVFSFTQSFIWFSYSKKHKTVKTFFKIFLMNFIVLTPCFMTLAYMMAKNKQEYLLIYIIMFAVMMHFVGIMNLHFAHHHKLRRAFYNMFDQGLVKIHRFILPYVLMILIYFALRYIAGLISHYSGINYYLLFFIFMLLFIAYVRNYFVIISKREVKDA